METAFDHFYYKNLLSCIKKLSKKDRTIAIRLVGVQIDLQNINWIIRLKKYYDLDLEQVLTTIIPGGFNLNRKIIDELYKAQNVEFVLRELVNSRFPGLSTLLSAQGSDSTSRLLMISQMLKEIIKHETKRILEGYPFTVGIILSYFILKQDELNKIRMILNAKQYGIEQERIESMI
jgi:V/A-type H+-transporting ATPase subunit C